jgi:hypothetical protein
MQPEIVDEAVAASVPIASEARPVDGRMHLTGTVRQRGADFVIEQRIVLDTGTGPRWTTPRIHRVMATAATRAALQASVDQVVTIVGTPDRGDERHRTSIVVESVQLQ